MLSRHGPFFQKRTLLTLRTRIFDPKIFGLLRSHDWIGGWTLVLQGIQRAALSVHDGGNPTWEAAKSLSPGPRPNFSPARYSGLPQRLDFSFGDEGVFAVTSILGK